MHLRHFVHGLPQSPCSLHWRNQKEILYPYCRTPLKPNSAINKHKNDTTVTFSTTTEMLLSKQHSPTLNNISKLISHNLYHSPLRIVRTILKIPGNSLCTLYENTR